jgi:RNA methyltransferase, TrmH family
MSEIITSKANPKIKFLAQLSNNQKRREQDLFVIEGAKEIRMALDAGYVIDSVYYCDSISTDKIVSNLVVELQLLNIPIHGISKEIFQTVAYRGSSDGIIVLAKPKVRKLTDIKLPADPFLIVLEALEKPGNLGAILRTADAAGVDAVIICNPLTDIYNPNAIRSSVGCVFSKLVVTCSSAEAFAFFRKNNITTYAAALTAKEFYHQVDLKKPTAVLFGTEADGLTDFWLTNSDKQIKIPMLGKNDSLNVAASAAIITFEAMRQRDFK